MPWLQKEIILSNNETGFILITSEVLNQIPEISNYKIGLLHLFIKHTSASLTINENADPTVRDDLESHFNYTIPENASFYKHTLEGADDMPAHIKSTIIGNSISIPISNGKLNLGTWQGIYLCEHRNNPPIRTIIVTIQGEIYSGSK